MHIISPFIVPMGMIHHRTRQPLLYKTVISASFWLGPYSSGLTGSMSPFANETNTILVAGGARMIRITLTKDYM